MSGRNRAQSRVNKVQPVTDMDQAARRGNGSSGRGPSDGTSKHFTKNNNGPVPIPPPPMYPAPDTSSHHAANTGREHGTRSRKGHEMPFSVPGMSGKKAAPKVKPAPAPKLDPVASRVFYGTTPRSQHPARPQTPADHANQSSRKDKGKDREIVDVDETDGEESIEDDKDFEQMPAPASAQRPSMTRGRETHHLRDEDGDEPILLEAQTAAGNKAKGVTKPKNTAAKGVPKSGLTNLGSFVGQGIAQLSIDGFRITPEDHSDLVVVCNNNEVVVRRKSGEKDLQIPWEPSFKYWLACQGDQVNGFMLDGLMMQRVREEWYKAIPSLQHVQLRKGRQRTLLAIALEAPIPKARFARGLTFQKIDYSTVTSPAALNAAYVIQLAQFENEIASAREQLKRTEMDLPSPSRDAPPLPDGSSKRDSKRPGPRRKNKTDPTDGPDKDGLIQTRIQPERSARLNAQPTKTEQPAVKKALPPKAPDDVMREWPSTGRTEVIITNGDFFRLEEAEYLNDTLIEFGLKFEWSKLTDDDSELTDDASGGELTRQDIHVFNSFFYKKLSVRNKPGYKEANPDGPSWPAYETVRKWTNKVNIFAKKMLIVPINENLHWYLAIILNPGAILQKTLAAAESIAVEDDENEGRTEAQQEAVLSQQFEEEKRQEEVIQAKGLADRSSKQDDERDELDIISSGEKPEDVDADSDVEELPNRNSDDDMVGRTTASRSAHQVSKPVKPPAPPPAPMPLTPPPEWRPAEEGKSTRRGPINPPPPKPKTPFSPDEPVIMTFDSLSATHPTVGKTLNRWLVYEALDKAKEQTSLNETDCEIHFPAAYKAVRVPGQDNFADCGVYVLHYAIQLMRDNGRLREYIFENAPVKGDQEKEKNKAIWDAMSMSEKREMWKTVISSLPAEKGESKKEEGKPEGSKDAKAADGTARATPAADPSVEQKADLVSHASSASLLGLDAELPSNRDDTVLDSIKPALHPPADTLRGTARPLSNSTKSSPMKRSIPVSPVAPQDGPVNKRRKIEQQSDEGQDICQDSQSEFSPRSDVRPLADDHVAHQDGLMEDSHAGFASPSRNGSILAPESPEIVELRRTSPSAMQSLTSELREVKMSEAPLGQTTSGRPSMVSGPLIPPPMSPVNAPTEIRDVQRRIDESARKENRRDKLRRDHDAEPVRSSSNPNGAPVGGASRIPAGPTAKRAGSPTRLALSDQQLQQLEAVSFGNQPAYLDDGSVGLIPALRDTVFQVYQDSRQDGNETIIRKLQQHYNPATDLKRDRDESTGTPSTCATVRGGMDTSPEAPTNGHAGNGPDVVHVSSDEEEDVPMDNGGFE